jgi:phosphatidate cytidylyltransferase
VSAIDAPALSLPARPALASALATRVATGIVLVAAVLAALFLLPTPGWGVVVLLIVVAAANEWAKLIGLRAGGRALFVAVTLLAGVALLSMAMRDGFHGTVIAVCGIATLFWIVVGVPSVLRSWQPASIVARVVAGWIVLLGAFVAIVSLQSQSPWLALAAMAIVWIADTAAYFTGRRFGRHKLAPRISPGKTREGAYGGIAAVVVYALLLLPLAARARYPGALDPAAIAGGVVFSIVLAALSIVGDLHESLLKRRAGVKDSGALLPGHGGVLDRIDALLAAMPPIALAAIAFPGAA